MGTLFDPEALWSSCSIYQTTWTSRTSSWYECDSEEGDESHSDAVTVLINIFGAEEDWFKLTFSEFFPGSTWKEKQKSGS